MRSALAFIAVASLLPLPASAAPTQIVDWLVRQRVPSCYPWFLSGIGPTNVTFDPVNVNPGKGNDSILDAGFLGTGTLVDDGDQLIRIVYDSNRRIALFDHNQGGRGEEYVLSDVDAPPAPVQNANLSAIETQQRIRLGTGFDDVVRKNGSAPRTVKRCGFEAVVYLIHHPHCIDEHDYVFRDRKLIAYGYGGDC